MTSDIAIGIARVRVYVCVCAPARPRSRGAATPKAKRAKKATLSDQMREDPDELVKRYCWVYSKLLRALATKLVEAGAPAGLHPLVVSLWTRYIDAAAKPKAKAASGPKKHWEPVLPRFELSPLPPLSYGVAMIYIGLRFLRSPLLVPGRWARTPTIAPAHARTPSLRTRSPHTADSAPQHRVRTCRRWFVS